MESRAHALVVGIFVLLAGAGAAAFAWWLVGAHDAAKDYLVVSGQPVTGLNPQAAVRYRGVNVGKVTAISLDPQNPRRVRIHIRLREEVPVFADSFARLGFQGLTGMAHLQIDDDGGGRPLAPGAALELRASLVDNWREAGEGALAEVRELTRRAKRILDEDNLRHLAATLAHLDAASARLPQTLERAEAGIAAMAEFASAGNAARLRATLVQVEAGTAQLPDAVRELRATLAVLRRAGSGLEGGEVAQAVASLSDFLEQSEALVARLRAAPQTLLWGESPGQPGPGEPGFAERK